MTEQAAQRSVELWDSDYYCAESVFTAVAEAQGIEGDFIPKIASGFCSGLARTGAMCGALSGAVLGISLVKGRSSPEEPMDPLYADIQELIKGFEEKFGSTSCRSLIQLDVSTEEGREEYKERGLHSQCSEYIAEATRMAMKLLAN